MIWVDFFLFEEKIKYFFWGSAFQDYLYYPLYLNLKTMDLRGFFFIGEKTKYFFPEGSAFQDSLY